MIKIITGLTYKSCVSFVMPPKIKFLITRFLCGASPNQMSNYGDRQSFHKRKSSPSSPSMGKPKNKKNTGSNQRAQKSGQSKGDGGKSSHGAGKGNNPTQPRKKHQDSEPSQRSRGGGSSKPDGRNNRNEETHEPSHSGGNETVHHVEYSYWSDDDEKELRRIRSLKGDEPKEKKKNNKEKEGKQTNKSIPPGGYQPQVPGSSVDSSEYKGGHSSTVDKVEKTAPTNHQTSISDFTVPWGSGSNQHAAYSAQRNSQPTKADQGIPIEKLNKAPSCLETEFSRQDILDSLPGHYFLSEGKGLLVVKESRHIDNYKDFVTTPFSDTTIYGEYTRWEHVKYYLENARNISDERQLEELIQNIRQMDYQRRDSFEAFYRFFRELRDSNIKLYYDFFRKTLPKMIDLALALPHICKEPIPFLKKETNTTLTLKQSQVACLLAHAFFCTFPHRPRRQEKGHEVPDINFSSLYSTFDEHGGRGDKSQKETKRKVQKLHCLVHYFMQVIDQKIDGNVTYQRVYDDCKNMKWYCLETKLTQLHVDTNSTIEEVGAGMLQADFANKFVGGGVLTSGLVQEEIRFVLCPEMILSRLFTEALTDKEVLLMTGCERFSNYTGYSDSFQFKGNYQDDTSRDALGRRYTEVVAMDALVFKTNKEAQFQLRHVARELNKAYVAFKGQPTHQNKPAVCTGNWGCGAFGGDKQLKALIQIMAASAAGRDVCYVTFGERELNQLGHIHGLLTQKNITIKDIITLLGAYGQKLYRTNERVEPLFDFLQEMISSDKVSGLTPVTDKSFTEGVQSQHTGRDWQTHNKPDARFRTQHSGYGSFSRDSEANQQRQKFNSDQIELKQFRNDKKFSRGDKHSGEAVDDLGDSGIFDNNNITSAYNLPYENARESNTRSENATGYDPDMNGDCSAQLPEKGGSGQQ